MKKIGILLALAATAALSLPVSAFERGDFDKIVDFSTTLKNLDESQAGRGGKLLILNGTVASIQLKDPKPESFAAQVELIAGEWIGQEEIRSFRCFVLFEGAEYYKLFADKESGSAAGAIKVNNRILVVARPIELISVDTSRKEWVLRGYHLRPLQ